MSTQQEHGPWKAARNSSFWVVATPWENETIEQATSNSPSVAYVWGDAEGLAESRAHLIASAPELLKELKLVREVIAASNQSFIEGATNNATGLIDDPEDLLIAEADQDLINGIDAVIAKATGSAS